MSWVFRILLASAIIVVGVGLYVNSDFYIAKQSWKYGNGAHIGDWVEFTKGQFEIRGRDIYSNRVRVARIRYCDGEHLVVFSFKTGESGYYHNK